MRLRESIRPCEQIARSFARRILTAFGPADVSAIMAEANEFGVPAMRPLFLEFPDDAKVQVNEAASEGSLMFGPDYLVSPVTEYAVKSWSVYLPSLLPAKATWVHHYTNRSFAGGQLVEVDVSDLGPHREPVLPPLWTGLRLVLSASDVLPPAPQTRSRCSSAAMRGLPLSSCRQAGLGRCRGGRAAADRRRVVVGGCGGLIANLRTFWGGPFRQLLNSPSGAWLARQQGRCKRRQHGAAAGHAPQARSRPAPARPHRPLPPGAIVAV